MTFFSSRFPPAHPSTQHPFTPSCTFPSLIPPSLISPPSILPFRQYQRTELSRVWAITVPSYKHSSGTEGERDPSVCFGTTFPISTPHQHSVLLFQEAT